MIHLLQKCFHLPKKGHETATPNSTRSKAKVYLIGSGIASLASALYLEKDAGVLGKNIHILEKDNIRYIYFFTFFQESGLTI
jgi:myosin-crossreactive antigen